MTEACSNCKYGRSGKVSDHPEDTFVSCRRYPPMFADDEWEFPFMADEDWCGEWAAKPLGSPQDSIAPLAGIGGRE